MAGMVRVCIAHPRIRAPCVLTSLTTALDDDHDDHDDADRHELNARHDALHPGRMMQTASFYQPPLAAKPTVQMGDTTRTSVAQLLAGAVATPCSTAAHTFVQIVPPLSRFQLALDVLMPMLDSPGDVSLFTTQWLPRYGLRN